MLSPMTTPTTSHQEELICLLTQAEPLIRTLASFLDEGTPLFRQAMRWLIDASAWLDQNTVKGGTNVIPKAHYHHL